MSGLIGPINSGDAAGGAGVATANADSPQVVRGFIEAIYIKYNDSPPAGTTDVVIATKGTSPRMPTVTLLTITNGATDSIYRVRAALSDEAGAATTAPADGRVYVDDFINAKISQANNGDNIDVWLLVSDS